MRNPYSQARFKTDENRMRYTGRSNVNEEADENDTAVTGDRAPSRADRQKRIMRKAHISPFSRAASVDTNEDMFRKPRNLSREQPE
jgi:hypothetical protein